MNVVFDPDEWQAAWILARHCKPPTALPSLEEMVRLIAGFGGFIGRQCDGYPGPLGRDAKGLSIRHRRRR